MGSPIGSVRAIVSPEEWEQRVNLAACYRLVALHGWDDLIFTHVSARVPGEDDAFLINAYGMLFDEITASSLVKVDHRGKKLIDTAAEINPAGFVIHSAIHAEREDVACVLHVHTPDGVAVSAQKGGLLPLSQQSTFVLSSLGYHDYEGVVLSEDEQPRLVRDLAHRYFLMLRNHGLLTVGSSVAEAFLFMYLFQSACTIQLRAERGGGELVTIDPKIIVAVAKARASAEARPEAALAWDGLRRRLDRIDPSYKE